MRVGDFAHEGGANVSVIDTDSYWIDGYFEETKLARACIGDRVEAKLMGYAEPILGHVASVTRGIGVSDAAGGPEGDQGSGHVFAYRSTLSRCLGSAQCYWSGHNDPATRT